MRILAISLGVLAVGGSLPQSSSIAAEPTWLLLWGIGLLGLSSLLRVARARRPAPRVVSRTASRSQRQLDLVNQSLVGQAQG